MALTETEFSPPAFPPPLLSDDQLRTLAKQGWIPMPPNPELMADYAILSQLVSTFLDQGHEEKMKTYPNTQGTELGFYRVENEKEYVTLRSNVHPSSELEIQAAKIWRATALMLQRIMQDISRGLDGPPDIWDSLLDGCLALPEREEDITPSLMRLFRYYPGSGFATQHVDLGFLTLCVGDGRGLQVLDRTATTTSTNSTSSSTSTNRWIDAEGPTILVGETLRILTCGLVAAGEHRVVENPAGRSSIVFALRPSTRHDVDLGQFGGRGVIPAQMLYDRIRNSKFNVNASKEVREEQRKKLDERKVLRNDPSSTSSSTEVEVNGAMAKIKHRIQSLTHRSTPEEEKNKNNSTKLIEWPA